MKKNLKHNFSQKNFLRIAALTFLLTLFSLINAQNQTQKVSIKLQNATLKEFIKQIESKTSFTVVYRDVLIDEKNDITISVVESSLEEVIKEVFAKKGLQAVFNNKTIVITKKKVEPQPQLIEKTKKVSGIVLDEKGIPVIGANIMIPGTKIVAVTDINGQFSLEAPSNAKLRISYIGYEPKIEEIRASSDVRVSLEQIPKKLEEVVVVGYGTMKKRDVTGSITSISSDAIEKKMTTNLLDALQGQAAGVQITAGSGQPGEESTIKIRGTSTFSADGVQPLFIVDGIPMDDIDGINPSDVTSMEILKDAASAAIYGSRSANGVIIITTKEGNKSKPRIEIKYNHSWGTLSHKLSQANRADRRYYDLERKQYLLANGLGNSDESIQMIKDSLNPMFNVDNDYQNMVLNLGRKDQIDVSLSGGVDKLKYFINTGYYDESGIVKNTGFKRLTTRINSDYIPSNWLKIGSRISLTYSRKNGIDEGNLFSSILSRRPYFSTFFPDGSMVGVFNGQQSPFALVNYSVDYTDSYKANFLQFFEFDITKDLKFRTNLNVNFYLDKRIVMNPSIITDEWQLKNYAASYNSLNWSLLDENFLTYTKKWNKNNFSAMLGVSAQQWQTQNETLIGRNSSTDFIYTMNAFTANLDLTSTGSWQTAHSLASVFARVTYDYAGKYLLTGNIRRDGSSRFAPENKWGNFPSVSVGWRVSDENFMEFAKKILDDAKIRVSYGVTGNEAMGNYNYINSYTPDQIYDGIGGISPTRIGVDKLKWEETRQFDIGMDLSFWNGKLTLTTDYYNKYTDGLLANYELPKESGYSSMTTNIGAMSNKGVEFTLSGDIIRQKDFNWNASFNISYNLNKIEKLSEGKPYMVGNLWWMQEGGKVGDFYGFKCLGVFQYDQSNAFAADTWQQLTPVFLNGIFQNKYLLNGQDYTGAVAQKKLPNGVAFRGGDYNWDEVNGQRNGIIDDNDRMVIGNALPDFTGGFNTQITYKNISLYVGLNYSLGGQIYNDAEYNRNSFRLTGTTPAPQVIYNVWLNQGDQALYPRPYNDDFNNARYANSFYIEDASFIRLQNVRLTYDLPKNTIKNLGVKGCGLYAYVNNALTWTRYSGFNPEFSTRDPLQIGKDTYRYPKKREFGIGFNVNF